MADEPYRDEREALRAKVAVLEADLADARDALKKDALPSVATKKKKKVGRAERRSAPPVKSSASQVRTWASPLLGGPSEMSEHRSVDGVIGADGQESIEALIRARKHGVGGASVIGRTFQYTIHDTRTDTRLFEVRVVTREGRTIIDAREVVGHLFALTHLCGVFIAGWVGALWLWIMMKAHLVASISWVVLMAFVSRLIVGMMVTSRRRALASLSDEIAAQCAVAVPKKIPRKRVAAFSAEAPALERRSGDHDEDEDTPEERPRTRRRR